MFATKLKIISAVFLAASLVGLGFFLQAGATLSADQAHGEDDPQVASSGLREAAEPVAAKSAVDAALLARHKTQSQNNLKELALAMHNYLDTHQHFPPPATYAGRMMGPGMPGMARGGMMPPGFPSGPGAMKPGLQPPGGPGPGGSQPGGFRPKTTPPGGGATPKPQPSAGGGLPGGGGPAAPGSAQPPGGAPGAGGPVPGGDTPQPPGASGFPGGPGGSGGGPPRFPGPVMGPRGGGATSGGQALLSWRVALLPYLGENDLYKQFRLNEPWDSAHNLKLLKKMPKVFAPPGIKTQTPYSTFYQVFVGPHAAFEKHRGVRIFEFTDGTSNTILIIEAGFPVPWTKPADLHYAADEPLPELGGIFTDVMHAAFADGSVHTLSRKCDQDMLRRAIVRDDGNVVDWSKLHRSVNRSVSGLQTEKLQLTEELRAERDRLEALRREVAELKSRADAAGTEALRRENEHLQQLLFETRREAQRLRDEIERLKKALPPK